MNGEVMAVWPALLLGRIVAARLEPVTGSTSTEDG